jgi:hypothetical protein
MKVHSSNSIRVPVRSAYQHHRRVCCGYVHRALLLGYVFLRRRPQHFHAELKCDA